MSTVLHPPSPLDGVVVPEQPPSTADLQHLRPSNWLGTAYTLGGSTLTLLALYLSAQASFQVWLLGQGLLAVALLQWFVFLHECGHNTLFRSRWCNQFVGVVAGFCALIPFGSWKLVHGMHHKWTGWQDLDVTTAILVPRRLARVERFLVNFCWRTWLPLFSTLYRWNNFWNLPRLFRYFPEGRQRRALVVQSLCSLSAYGLVITMVGPALSLQLIGLGLLLCLMMEDPLILSQHTHVPMHLSEGQTVKPFMAREQEVFTRSLRFPSWVSRYILLYMDAHELHHMYAAVPGYHLGRIPYRPMNEEPWWSWIRRAKRIPAEVFLFQNRLQSGLDV